MKILYSWLKDYVDFNWDVHELAERLTHCGLEVEGIETLGANFPLLVVGEILSTRKHENADKLTVCEVHIGENENLTIVCGAPNVATGQKVPVAKVGAILPGDFEIKQAKIRGVSSSGMICSKSELGFEEGKSDGIWVLEQDTPVGLPLNHYLKSEPDWVLDISITANRGDCLSHIGVAREVAALTGNHLKLPETTIESGYLLDQSTDHFIDIKIEDEAGCANYTGWYVEHVKAIESPEWLKYRLESVGSRPINVLVDITNYILLETGQPLHAFDYEKLKSKVIKVKTFDHLTFTTLDSKERHLPPQSLMICDNDDPIAIAGVMGGENSEVDAHTTRVLIESAYFDPSRIRFTSKQAGLSTDASYRFERGVDRELQYFAAQRAGKLMAELTGGKVARNGTAAKVESSTKADITLRLPQVKRILGVELDPIRIKEILQKLGFGLVRDGSNEMVFSVPSHRHDVTREIDLIEELIRITGFDALPESTNNTVTYSPEQDAGYRVTLDYKRLLNGLGYQEWFNNSLISEAESQLISRFGVPLQNPQSEDMAYLRPSLIPGLLKTTSYNLNRGLETVKAFEFGHIFTREPSSRYAKIQNQKEVDCLGLIQSGVTHADHWKEKSRKIDFYDFLGSVQSLFKSIEVDHSPVPDWMDYGVNLSIKGNTVGHLGKVADTITQFFTIKQPVYICELNWDLIRNELGSRQTFTPISKFVAIEKDMAFWLKEETKVGDIISAIRNVNPEWIRNIEVFDVFHSKEEQKKSVAFRLTLLDENRTFTDTDIDGLFKSIEKTVKSLFDAVLRG